MGRKKNPPEGSADEERYSEPVKFRPKFKEKLELVARDLGKYPGQLVEEHMTKFIAAEEIRILREKLAEAESEARRDRK